MSDQTPTQIPDKIELIREFEKTVNALAERASQISEDFGEITNKKFLDSDLCIDAYCEINNAAKNALMTAISQASQKYITKYLTRFL